MICHQDRNFTAHGSNTRIRHGFFCRDVERDDVLSHFGPEATAFASVKQVHGTVCAPIETPPPEGTEADALATRTSGIILGVRTADCGPILLTGKDSQGQAVVGAAHAGWKGALNGIGESVVREMLALGALPETIGACIGPCIGPAHYEVEQSFAEPFLDRNPEDERFFRSGQRPEHLQFDLPGYIAARLSEAGVRRVSITGLCTYARPDRFFSYRKATHAATPLGPKDRQLSCILISRKAA